MAMGGEAEVIETLVAANAHLRKLVDWQITKNDALREALQVVVTYWDDWKDAPNDHDTALSLEEVIHIARSTLEGFK